MTLEEWAQSLRLRGDSQQAEFAVEILEYIDRDNEFERLQSLEEDLLYERQRHDLKQDMPADKILEWLSNQAGIVEECNQHLKKHGFEGQDLDDQVEQLVETVANIEETLRTMGGYAVDDSSDLDALVMDLCRRPKYDL